MTGSSDACGNPFSLAHSISKDKTLNGAIRENISVGRLSRSR